MKKLNIRAKARLKAHNNREFVRLSRLSCDFCTLCPANDIENLRGSHSVWGRKRAARREYTTGKHRSEGWKNRHTWLLDKADK